MADDCSYARKQEDLLFELFSEAMTRGCYDMETGEIIDNSLLLRADKIDTLCPTGWWTEDIHSIAPCMFNYMGSDKDNLRNAIRDLVAIFVKAKEHRNCGCDCKTRRDYCRRGTRAPRGECIVGNCKTAIGDKAGMHKVAERVGSMEADTSEFVDINLVDGNDRDDDDWVDLINPDVECEWPEEE